MIAPQDFDRLSAYVDNQLSPAEKARIEARLEREPGLKAAFDDLRMTVRALRSLPAVKPPRNFTLSREFAHSLHPPRRAFPALRLATAFAALAFVVAVVGDFTTNLASPAAAPASVAQKNAAPTETPIPPAAQEAITVTREVSAESAAATPSAADTTTETDTPAAALAVPEPTVAAGGAGGETAPGAPPTLAPTTDEAGQRAATTVTATPQPGLVVPFVANGAPTPAPAPPEAPSLGTAGPPPLRYIEAGLALLTILFAIAAWFWRGR